MANQLAPLSTLNAEEANAIGALFQQARLSHADSVKHLIACGTRLRAIKESRDHGTWLLWLKEHQEVLGFTDRTAQLLMRGAANTKLASDLDEDQAAKLSRNIWGHAPSPKVEIEEHGPEYRQLARMFDWFKSHPAWTVNSCLSRAEASDLREQVAHAREWFTSRERAIATLPGSNGRLIENAKAL